MLNFRHFGVFCNFANFELFALLGLSSTKKMRQFIIVIEKYTKNDGNQNINGSTSLPEKTYFQHHSGRRLSRHCQITNVFSANLIIERKKSTLCSSMKQRHRSSIFANLLKDYRQSSNFSDGRWSTQSKLKVFLGKIVTEGGSYLHCVCRRPAP